MSGSYWYETATLQVSEFRDEWCPTCLLTTLQCGDIFAITSQGVRRVGGFAVCAKCGWSPHDGAQT
jgi:hypothetical protein